MASSSSSATREALAEYLAGRASAAHVAARVAEAYYRGRGVERERLRPVMEVIERAAPGVVGLVRTEGGAGFDIHLIDRPFPRQEEAHLRHAIEQILPMFGGGGSPEPGGMGLLTRVVRAVRRLFSASA
jgi:hypothetical protein